MKERKVIEDEDQFQPEPADVVDEGTQGEVLVGAVTHAGLEQAVVGYIMSAGHVLGAVAEAAEKLAEDGLSLIDFARLLRGEDL